MSDSVMVRHGIQYERFDCADGRERYVAGRDKVIGVIVRTGEMWEVAIAGKGGGISEGAAGTLDEAFKMARSFVDGGFNG